MTSTISDTYVVAWGSAVGRFTPMASMASYQSASYSAATRSSDRPSALALLMMLSSTSVMLET
ncbi:MAG: hypothetical protein WKF43_02060 [Acidimicrobiales bacterium]